MLYGMMSGSAFCKPPEKWAPGRSSDWWTKFSAKPEPTVMSGVRLIQVWLTRNASTSTCVWNGGSARLFAVVG